MAGLGRGPARLADLGPPPPYYSVNVDPFIDSDHVAYLNPNNFLPFLSEKDAAMVFFYTPGDKDNDWLKTEITERALITATAVSFGSLLLFLLLVVGSYIFRLHTSSTKRANHVYAAVNCSRDKELCIANKVSQTPDIKQGQGDVLDITKPDPYFNTSLVHSLNESNFGGFLWTKDAALVMFYNPSDSMSSVFKKDFAMAAGSTKRANHAFAAVNCHTHRRLCRGHDVYNTPTFVLFSKGEYVGSVRDVRKFRANSLRQYVETTSIL